MTNDVFDGMFFVQGGACYLHYAPLKGLTDDMPVIQITYIMDDGAEVVVKANEKTVWWNGKPSAIHDEGKFVKMCTAVFFLQNG